MNFDQAFDVLKKGGSVSRAGRTLILRRGLLDVTGEEPKQYYFSEEDKAAEDWSSEAPDEAPAVVAPDVVDDVLREDI
jgi:hypothetical protein